MIEKKLRKKRRLFLKNTANVKRPDRITWNRRLPEPGSR
jgi:hypothetical protein